MVRRSLAVLAAVVLCSHTQAATVSWGAQISNGVGLAGIGMANGTALVNGSGDVILLGSFSINNSQIALNGSNYVYLMSQFTQFGSAVIGQGNPAGAADPASHDNDGYWTAITTATAGSLQGKEMYYWVFDSPTPSTATQYGIFTSSSLWQFPNDLSNPNTISTDLSQVAHDMSGILFGSYGNGLSADGSSPLYNLGIVAVPEPSTWLAATLGAGSLLFRISRRRTKSQ